MKSSQKTEETEKFFNQWAMYQRVIAQNYMVHAEISMTLQRFLQALPVRITSFMDLGCGDAFIAAKLLPAIKLKQYCGVDLSATALQFAETNLQVMACAKQFINEDLAVAIAAYRQEFDIICAGYSLHHLQYVEKQAFFKCCAKALKPRRYFGMDDLGRIEPETREQCLQRHWQVYSQWAFSDSELESIKTHVFEQDYAESSQSLKAIAKTAGFTNMETLFVDQQKLFAVYCFVN